MFGAGIESAGWEDLNGSPFLVEQTTKTTITLENTTAIANMGSAADGSVKGGSDKDLRSNDYDRYRRHKETVRIGGHGLEVSGGSIDLTGAHAGTAMKLQDDSSTSLAVGSADHPNLMSISTKTNDEHVAFTHDLKMVGDPAKHSTLYIGKRSNLVVGEASSGQFPSRWCFW